jgi:hypothetical protein
VTVVRFVVMLAASRARRQILEDQEANIADADRQGMVLFIHK